MSFETVAKDSGETVASHAVFFTVSATEWLEAIEKIWSHPDVRAGIKLNRVGIGWQTHRRDKPTAGFRMMQNSCPKQHP